MKETDQIDMLFRRRLNEAELPVRDGFYEEMWHDLATAQSGGKGMVVPLYRRLMVAASVLLLLGLASAAVWHLLPRNEVGDAFTCVETSLPAGIPMADLVHEAIQSPHHVTSAPQPAPSAVRHAGVVIPTKQEEEEEEMVRVHLSITIREHMYGQHPAAGGERTYGDALSVGYGTPGHRPAAEKPVDTTADMTGTESVPSASSHPSRWALKAGIGSSLPKGEAKMPVVASVTAEYKLNSRLALEAGLQYQALPDEQTTYHTLSIPLRIQALLTSMGNMDLYALAGGTAEKCLSGAPDNSFSAEPVRLAVQGGLGIRYRLNERLALFAEPTVSHHFSTDAESSSLRTERPTNFNLLCGLRMTY